jgi:hypothetical protein
MMEGGVPACCGAFRDEEGADGDGVVDGAAVGGTWAAIRGDLRSTRARGRGHGLNPMRGISLTEVVLEKVTEGLRLLEGAAAAVGSEGTVLGAACVEGGRAGAGTEVVAA